MHPIIQELKARRKELGLTQAEMARRLEVSQPNYHKIESGGNPSLKTLTFLALALNMRLMLVPQEKVAAVEDIIRPQSRAKKLQSLMEQYEVKDNE